MNGKNSKLMIVAVDAEITFHLLEKKIEKQEFKCDHFNLQIWR
jgi:hypothetical protein